MISFSQYIRENSAEYLGDVGDVSPSMENTAVYNHDFVMAPSAVLGLHNTTKDLPQRAPYGFWVNKWGHWAPVGVMQHADVAHNIMNAYNDWQKDPKKQFRALRWVYRVLWANGWVRVLIDDGDTIYWEHPSKEFTLSQSQQKFFKDLQMLYYKPVARDRVGDTD